MKKHLRLLTLAAIVCLLLVSSISFGQGLKPGTAAPKFELITLDGDTLKASDYAGKVLILHFWKAN